MPGISWSKIKTSQNSDAIVAWYSNLMQSSKVAFDSDSHRTYLGYQTEKSNGYEGKNLWAMFYSPSDPGIEVLNAGRFTALKNIVQTEPNYDPTKFGVKLSSGAKRNLDSIIQTKQQQIQQEKQKKKEEEDQKKHHAYINSANPENFYMFFKDGQSCVDWIESEGEDTLDDLSDLLKDLHESVADKLVDKLNNLKRYLSTDGYLQKATYMGVPDDSDEEDAYEEEIESDDPTDEALEACGDIDNYVAQNRKFFSELY